MTTDDSTGRPYKRTLSLLLLLALNAGTGHILTSEIINRVSAQGISFIKDEQVSATEAGILEGGSPIAPIESEADTTNKHEITIYSVKSGDTIGGIASKYHVSTNTIRWANDLGAKGTIKPGDKLTILPITGIQHTVKKGDTINALAKKYDTETADILQFNALDSANDITVGMELIIPDGEPVATAPTKTEAKAAVKAVTKTATVATKETTSTSSSTTSSAYKLPIPGSVLTQGVHGSNGVDFGAPVGTTVKAALSGEVILAKKDGAYNGGYGNYIVIKHSNGTQTLYAHLSSVSVAVGESVSTGEVIGKSGNTGRSTGPHLHFEVRGATNPFGKNKVGTHY